MTERWLPVVGYEGWYEVSDLGRVRTVRASKRAPAGFVHSPTRMVIGYHMVTLSKNSSTVREKKYVHELVVATFIGPRPPKQQINHKDGVKTNNVVTNLEYVTHAENARHASRIGLSARGERTRVAKLDETKVREIRRIGHSMSYYRLAEQFGVSYTAVWNVLNRVSWKHLP